MSTVGDIIYNPDTGAVLYSDGDCSRIILEYMLYVSRKTSLLLHDVAPKPRGWSSLRF